MHIRKTSVAPRTRRFSRLQMITGAIAGIAGFAAAPTLTRIPEAKAAGYAEDDMLNFVAEGPANTGFSAAGVDTSGVPLFANGAVTVGSTYGLLAKSPNIGIRGGGDDNSTGVMGISFTDATEGTPGSGTGVQGNSGTGSGVAGFSESGTGVFGESDGASGIGVSGKGDTGMRGAGTNNSIGVHGFSFSDSTEATPGTGTGVQGDSGTGIGVAGFSDSHIGVYGNADGTNGVGVQGSGITGIRGGGDDNSTGVLGISFSDSTEATHGSGTGVQGNSGTGSGVAGFSDSAAGVFGESDGPSGVGVSGKGQTGMRGAGINNSVGVHGFSFTDATEATAGKGAGVQGDSGSGIGVAGFSDSHIGVYGQATGASGVGAEGSGPIGVRGGGTTNSTGVLGVSYADASGATLGSGSGVHGNSGTGPGVSGHSAYNAGVYGTAGGVTGVGVSGNGSIGVSGTSGAGIGVQGSSVSAAGVTGLSASGSGVVAKSERGYALEAYGGSPDLPTIYAQTTGTKGSTAGAIQASSAHGFGVLGTTSAAPTTYATGVGITGVHVNGYGAGVAGYSVKPPKKGKGGSNVMHVEVAQGCGVFGVGDQAGVQGSSGEKGDGVRGTNTANGIGVYGASFETAGEETLGAGNGVQGSSGQGSGVAGFSHKGSGVYGQSGVIGVQGKGRIGVLGNSNKGAGVTGQTKSGVGVKGEATTGSGVVAVSASKTQPALVAANSSTGPAIAASASNGYGAELSGGQAPLRLIPSASQGSPTSGRHLNGEIMMDGSGNLYICVQSGTPGSWKRAVLE
jgi:hypothetical protein